MFTYHGNYFRIIEAHRVTVQFRILRREELLIGEFYAEDHNEYKAKYDESHKLEEVSVIIMTNTII